MNQSTKKKLKPAIAILAMAAVISVMNTVTTDVYLFLAILTLPFNIKNADFSNFEALYNSLIDAMLEPDFLAWVSDLYAVIGIVIFLAWYKELKREEGFMRLKKANDLTNKPLAFVPGLIITCIALGFLAEAIVSVITILAPDWVMEFEDMMDMAGLTGNVVPMMLIYSWVLAPIVEELAIRGVGFTYAKRAFGPTASIILSAVLFGIMHMNKVQFVYTFFIGLAFGYMVYKFNNLWVSIFAHIFYNAIGTTIAGIVGVSLESAIIFYLTVFGTLAVLYLGMMLLKKSAPIVEELPPGSHIDEKV